MSFTSEEIRAISVGDRVNLVSSKTRGNVTHHVETRFPKDEAPAVALAILEAAGHPLRRYQPGEMRDLPDVAHDALKRHLAHHEEQAKREAEDAKVREFALALQLDPGVPACYHGVSDRVREQYRAARKFFEES